MMTLSCKQLYLPAPPVQTLPAQSISFPKPLSYEFRVAEHMNTDGTIAKVGLQVQVTEHDEYGVGVVKQYWADVERVKIPYVAIVG
jgi:hypothetical protein